MIDTVEISHKLQATGLPQNQAEAIAQTFLEVPKTADLATKTDLATLKADLIYWIVGSVGLSTLLQFAASLLRH